MLFDSVGLLAIASVVLCLVAGGAHFFELANKMSLSPDEYMTVQKIYAGWSLFGIAIVTALVLTSTHTFMVRDNRTAFLLSLAAVLCLAVTQVIFWMFTYPINAASHNWMTMPAKLRGSPATWEYSHVVNAVLTFVALVAITLSVFAEKREVTMTQFTV
jgi:hypothetical protein